MGPQLRKTTAPARAAHLQAAHLRNACPPRPRPGRLRKTARLAERRAGDSPAPGKGEGPFWCRPLLLSSLFMSIMQNLNFIVISQTEKKKKKKKLAGVQN